MFLQTLFADGGADRPGPTDDWWYQDFGFHGGGVVVNRDTAMTVAAVYAAVRVLAETLAQVPFKLVETVGQFNRDAEEDPLYSVIHDDPNPWQTSAEFREMMMGHLALRGNAYARIIPGPRGPVDRLVPLHPDRITPVRLTTGEIEYLARYPDATSERLRQGEMLHLKSISADGLQGMSPLTVQAQTFGMAIAANDYASRFFINDATPPGVITVPWKFKDEEEVSIFRKAWDTAHTGVNRHKTAVLEQGAQYTKIGLSNTDAQVVEQRKLSVSEVARIFRVPPHMIGDLEKATFSNIEQESINFVRFGMLPWFVKWEQRCTASLVVNRPRYRCAFVIEGLLRGTTKERYEAHGLSIRDGWKTRNEVRVIEGLNPLPGLDEPLQQLNMSPAPGDNTTNAKRLIKSELEAVRYAYCSMKIGRFLEWCRTYWGTHHDQVQVMMGCSEETARAYCATSYEELKASGDIPTLLNQWEVNRALELFKLVEGERA